MAYGRVRGAFTRALTTLLLGLGLIIPVASPAGAGSIAQTRALIAKLSTQLAQQQRTSEITANQYDQAKVDLASINSHIVTLQHQEVTIRGEIADTTAKLRVDLVRAYVLGIADSQIMSLFNQKVTSSDARRVYEDEVIGNLRRLQRQYQNQRTQLDQTLAQLAQQQRNAAAKQNQLQVLLANNLRLEAATRKTLTQVTAQLKSQIISYEIAVGVAAAKHHDLAGQAKAIAAAAAVGGQAAANLVTEAIQRALVKPVIGQIAGSAQGLRALAYAKSQIGVPYVWGGETPGVGFDCSGLVQWAWARAGIQIPRTTSTQWPALHHVPLTALQPGDLLFYYNLDGDHTVDHVVMYAGSGPWGASTIIAAAHSGTNVSLAPLFTSGLIGAARP